MSTTNSTSGRAAPPSIAQRVRDTIGIDLQEVAGATVSGEIPIAAAAINRIIADRLGAAETPVASAIIEPHDDGRIIAYVKLRARIVPPLKIDARIEQQPELPDRPVLGLRWSIPGLGALALFVAPALAFFNKSLPRGFRVQGDWVGVDIHELMRSRGLDDLVPYLTGLQITTREGRVVVQFHVRS
jgi:hypothetical protein